MTGDDPSIRTLGGDADDGTDREFDARGWTLLGVTLVSFVVIPALILLRPPALPFKVAYLVLPLLPAILLGATAVWSARAD